jgi:hypothetical protein
MELVMPESRSTHEKSALFSETELFQYRLADGWNSTYRIGQRVAVHYENGRSRVTLTTSEAQVLFGQAVISLANITRCCPIHLITAI